MLWKQDESVHSFLFVKVPNFGAFPQARSAVIARFNGIVGRKNHEDNEHLKEKYSQRTDKKYP